MKMDAKIMDTDSIKDIPGITKVHEVIKNKFYFAIATNNGLESCLNLKNDQIIFYCAHNNLQYNPLIFDFGPYCLASIWNYSMFIRKYLKLAKSQNKVLVHITCQDKEKLVNSAFVCGCYAILSLNYEPEEIFNLLSDNNKTKFIGFRDACVAPSSYFLGLLDCFKAIKKASDLKFFDLDNFDVQEYVHYEKVKNGDLNWIIPNKMLAFSGPHNKTEYVNGYPRFSPEFYFDFFRKNNVTTIIRLNEKRYDERKFTDNGFDHKDLIFRDGTSPNLETLNEFLKTCEDSKGAVAVHCKAGLGRSGTLIACYLIKHYKFTAHEAIAWTRICRPGSVIANQQTFLIKNEPYLNFKRELYDLEQKNKDEIGIDNIIDLLYQNELTNKPKKLTCKLNKANLKIDDQPDDPNENDKDTQGDILNKLKWTRSKSRLMQVNQDNKLSGQFVSTLIKNSSRDLQDLDLARKWNEQSELLRINDTNKNSSLSIKKLIQHYNSKSSENERDNFQRKNDKPTNHYRTRSFTSILSRSKVHGSSITKPNLINNSTLMTDKLINKSIKGTNKFKINNKMNILPNERTRQSSKSRLSRADSK